MKMASDSESNSENERKKQLLEAADTILLTNVLFQKPETDNNVNKNCEEKKSQRFLIDVHDDMGIDVVVPETTQRFIAKKLAELISKKTKFILIPTEPKSKTKKHTKSRIKLLSDADCYVKPYEEFEYDSVGPTKKLEIKRRQVDEFDIGPCGLESLKSVTVEGKSIGAETKYWAKKRERADKIFKYKASKKGTLTYREPENEFTQLRNKNQWHESKIKRSMKRI